MQHVHNFFCTVSSKIISIVILPSSYMWFLWVLFFIFLIVGFIDLFNVSLLIELLVSLVILMISTCFNFQEVSPYGATAFNPLMGAVNPFTATSEYFLVFLIGEAINKYNIMKMLHHIKIAKILMSMWIILTCIQWIVLKHLHLSQNLRNPNSINYINMSTKLLSIFAFLSLFSVFNEHNKVFKYFDKYGKNTLLVYLVHYPFIYL